MKARSKFEELETARCARLGEVQQRRRSIAEKLAAKRADSVFSPPRELAPELAAQVRREMEQLTRPMEVSAQERSAQPPREKTMAKQVDHTTPVKELAAELGISVGNLYYYAGKVEVSVATRSPADHAKLVEAVKMRGGGAKVKAQKPKPRPGNGSLPKLARATQLEDLASAAVAIAQRLELLPADLRERAVKLAGALLEVAL